MAGRKSATPALGMLAGILLLGLVLASGCGPKPGAYKNGIYEGSSASGMHGEVKVQVSVAKGRIAEVKITTQNETQGIGTIAIEKLSSEILEKQGTDVAAVSGASVTSKAFLEAAADALAKAK